MNTCNFREFVRFTYQQNIVPALIPPEDAVQIYRQLIRERLDQTGTSSYLNDKLTAQVLDYEYFKKSLVRIAIMAQDELGGQKEDMLLGKLESETKKKQEDQKKRDKQRKQQDDKNKLQSQCCDQFIDAFLLEEMKEEYKNQMQKTQKSPSKTGKGVSEEVQYEINQNIKEKEEAFFEKWMKQREAQGISLKKRIIGKEKEGPKKTIIKKKVTIGGKGDDMDDLREGDDFEDGNGQTMKGKAGLTSTIGGSSVVRKTKALKALKELEEKEHIKDSLAQTKIENKKIRKDLNVMVVTAKTIEALMKLMEEVYDAQIKIIQLIFLNYISFKNFMDLFWYLKNYFQQFSLQCLLILLNYSQNLQKQLLMVYYQFVINKFKINFQSYIKDQSSQYIILNF